MHAHYSTPKEFVKRVTSMARTKKTAEPPGGPAVAERATVPRTRLGLSDKCTHGDGVPPPSGGPRAGATVAIRGFEPTSTWHWRFEHLALTTERQMPHT